MTDFSLSALSLRHVIEHSASLYPNHPALSCIGDKPLTYQELHEAAAGLSAWLAEQGIGYGDSVVILSENSPNWGLVYLAVTTMGAVAVPVLTEFHSDAIAHIIRHCEAKAVFVSEKLFPKIEDAVFDPSPLFVGIESFSPLSQGMTRDMFRDLKSKGLRELRKWKEKAMRLTHHAPARPAADDIAAIIYTSGTTGHSKGVMLSHANIVSNAIAAYRLVKLAANDRLLSILPLPHTFECTLGFILPLLCGAHVHYLDKPPTGRALLPAMTTVKPTVILCVPLIIEKIYKTSVLPKLTGTPLSKWLYGFACFRKFMNRAAGKKLLSVFGGELWLMAIGGAALAADAEIFLREAHFPYSVGYGLTEASPLLTGITPHLTRRYSVGPPLEDIEIRLGEVNPKTGEGEIQAKGSNIMRGYYKLPEMTEAAFTPDGWLKTGDLGAVDEYGFYYIKGRSKNVILGPSGENIYPEEVESFFFSSPYVLEALVYQHEGRLTARVHLDSTKLDDLLGELPDKEMEEKRLALLEDIRQAVNSNVSSFARIKKIIEQTEPFEKTATQKIKRYLYVDS